VITRWEILAYSASLPAGRGYVLRIHEESGLIGHGEARALDGFGTGPVALDTFLCDPAAVQSLVEHPEDDREAPVEAKFAVETAVLDLAAQREGVSLVQQLGFTQPDALQNSLLVSGEAEAMHLFRQGHRNFKLKAQGAAKDTLDLLRRLFEAGGGTTNIRVDANGSWDRDTVLSFLRQSPQDSICFVEQPFPVGDLDSCVWLRDRMPVPIALDEGAVSTTAIGDAARCGAAQLIIIKPMYRGFHGALRLATAAAEHGLGACVTHAMDGTVGRLATMHVAAAVDATCPESSWPHGLYAPGLTHLADEPTLQPDRLLMPGGAGLGLQKLRENELTAVCAGP